MNTILRCRTFSGHFTLLPFPFFVALSISLGGLQRTTAASAGKTFASPEEAAGALGVAANAKDMNALATIFGPAFTDVKASDPTEAQDEIAEFAQRFNASNHITKVAEDRCILEVGEDRWPFAVPLARQGSTWIFDTEAGKQEVLDRRIGANELEALKAIRAGADAQRASKDRDGDEVLEYAQKLVSSPGTKDGLYWSSDLDGEISPLGPALVAAQGEGYFQGGFVGNGQQPFHGYLFKILTRQGKNAPGGAYEYITNGNMIGGFAFVAWPAHYRVTGIMTFIINQQGKVYQKDLGPDTDAAVKKMKAYNPDPSWTLSPD
jgi:hypothetical protein